MSTAQLSSPDEVMERVATVTDLVDALPRDVLDAERVEMPPAFSPGAEAELDTPENRQRVRAYMDSLPKDERRLVMARMRNEGPEAVIRDILGGGATIG